MGGVLIASAREKRVEMQSERTSLQSNIGESSNVERGDRCQSRY